MIKKIRENRVSRTYLGGAKIDEFYGREDCSDSYLPEDWTASAVSAYNGAGGKEEGIGITYDGVPITDIVGEDKLPILVKLLNSAERLAVQAHPTVQFAKKYLNSSVGKTECWYFLDCTDEACVYIGFKEGIKKQDWIDVFLNNDSERMLSMLNCLPVKKGDFVFVSGGMPHAIGKGCFMVELQEPSDFTVINERFTSSGREIPEQRLHMGLGLEKMFDVYDYTGYSMALLREKCCPVRKKMSERLYEIVGPEFTDKFSMYVMKAGAILETKKKYRIAIVTSGRGCICSEAVQRGDRIFIAEEKRIYTDGDENFEVVVCE